MTNQLKSRFLIKSLIVVLFATFSITNTAFAVVTPPLTKCNIQVDDPHFSKSLQRHKGALAVKVNARSKCNKSMRNLKLWVEIYKVGFLRDHKVATEVINVDGLIFPNQVITNQDTYVICTDMRMSKYYGVAFASATINGRLKKTLKVTSAKSVSLKCGS